MKTEPEVLFEDIDNGVPAIVLDTVNNKNKSDPCPKNRLQRLQSLRLWIKLSISLIC